MGRCWEWLVQAHYEELLANATSNGPGGLVSGAIANFNITDSRLSQLRGLLDGQNPFPTEPIQLGLIFDDNAIVAADLWHPDPLILSANPGFDGIIGIRTDFEGTLAGGGTWIDDEQRESLCGPGFSSPESSAVPVGMGNIYNCKEPVDNDDGLPICFSWPVLPSSIKTDYLLYKRSDG